MPLYSSGAQTNAAGHLENGQEATSHPEEKNCADGSSVTTWSYLFVHRARVENLKALLTEGGFKVFVHTSIIYSRRKGGVARDERPTFSGLVFVQGAPDAIRTYLRDNDPRVHLAKDCTTGTTAVIPDSVMQPFMQISGMAPTRIRFMPHTFGYYAEGNAMVRITSGPMAGLEGYRIRISRDKCLVTTIGGMTVAIGGIHRESFENLEDFAEARRLQQTPVAAADDLTPAQAAVAAVMFTPQTRLDAMALAQALEPILTGIADATARGDYDTAADTALTLLDEAGTRARRLYESEGTRAVADLLDQCRRAAAHLTALLTVADLPISLRETIETGLDSLTLRHPFLPL